MRSLGRSILVFITALELVACSSSSGDDGTQQDADQDSASDGMAYDAPLDSTHEVSGDEGVDTTPFPDTLPETTPIDTSTDAGGCGDGAACGDGLTCCTDACRNTNNDPSNCGTCGHACTGATSMCLGGTCSTPVCAPACDTGSICCEIDGPGPTHFSCIAGTACPVGCPACK